MSLTVERCTYGESPIYGIFYGEWLIILLWNQAEAESARDMLSCIDWKKTTRYVDKHHKIPPKVFKRVYDVCCLFRGLVQIKDGKVRRLSDLKPECRDAFMQK